MSPADLVAAGAKQGLKIGRSLIYMVRVGQKKAKSGAPKKAGRPAAAPRGGTASEFIRKHPDLAVPDLVDLGAKQGLKFSRNLVYLVRGPRGRTASAPAASLTSPGRPAAPRVTQVTVARATGSASGEVEELARLMLHVGLERSQQILSRLKSAIG